MKNREKKPIKIEKEIEHVKIGLEKESSDNLEKIKKEINESFKKNFVI